VGNRILSCQKSKFSAHAENLRKKFISLGGRISVPEQRSISFSKNSRDKIRGRAIGCNKSRKILVSKKTQKLKKS